MVTRAFSWVNILCVPPNRPGPFRILSDNYFRIMLKVKVCGIRNLRNMLEVAAVGVDYLGFIFYRPSKRYVGDKPDMELFKQVNSSITKVGVFVDEDVNTMLEIMQRYNLNVIQLHGGETPAVCEKLKAKGAKVIKAFGMDASFDFSVMQPYMSVCDYFLFDTRSYQHGGTGIKFNWHKIDEYEFDKPFFLSGGIGAEEEPY